MQRERLIEGNLEIEEKRDLEHLQVEPFSLKVLGIGFGENFHK